MELILDLPLLNDLKLIVIDYMGENTYQLNYKKCIEEYDNTYYFCNSFFYIDNIKTYKSYNWRDSNIHKIAYVYNKKVQIVSLLSQNYWHQKLYL